MSVTGTDASSSVAVRVLARALEELERKHNELQRKHGALQQDYAVLEERLRTRAQDSELVVAQRMARAADEISHWAEYDYVIVNDDLDRSMTALLSILTAERQRRDRLVGLADFVREMQQSL